MNQKKFLMLAGYAPSLTGFRGSLISAIQKKGLQMHAAAPGLNEKTSVGKELASRGVILHDISMQRTGKNPFSDLLTFWYFFCLIRSIKPDWVMAYTIKPVIYGMIAAWFNRVPHRFALITGLGYAFQNSEKRAGLQTIVKNLYKYSLACASGVFFQNPDDRCLFVNSGILNENNKSYVVNGSGVDLSNFPLTKLPNHELEGCSFLLIARLLGDKGVREYVEAARIVKEKYSNTKIKIVGYLDENPDSISQSELDEWCKEGSIEYLGKLDDVRSAIESSAVYVLPSYREGTPRTVLEAMAMGRAIITTDAPGCRETVIDGENGFLVPVRDSVSLAFSMQRFIENPLLIELMGKKSREIAEKKYDVNKVNDFMLCNMGIK